ncbi:hypothetical protein JCM10207_007076 [Rhodosporidiobolus poonsookiae]
MSRTAPSARLPAVGTVFPSLLDFKIAVFRAAEAGSFQVRVFSCCRARHAVLNCIGCGSKPAVEKGLLTACTCRVRAYKSKHGGGFEVRSATAAHSCVVPAYNSVEGRANRKDMHVRVVTLEAERDGESSSDSGAAEETDDLSSVTDSASGSDSNAKRVTVTTQSGRQSILTDRYGSTLPPPKRMKRTAAPVKQDERSLNRHSTPAFSKRLLMKEIEKLAEGPPLSLPAPSDTFSDPRALLLRIYTWSHQRSICLNHGDYVGRITFICKPTSQGPRCPFEISMTEADDGEWSVTDWKREHDMALHGWDEENQKENEPAGPSQDLALLLLLDDASLVELVAEVQLREGWADEAALGVAEVIEAAKSGHASERG